VGDADEMNREWFWRCFRIGDYIYS